MTNGHCRWGGGGGRGKGGRLERIAVVEKILHYVSPHQKIIQHLYSVSMLRQVWLHLIVRWFKLLIKFWTVGMEPLFADLPSSSGIWRFSYIIDFTL